MRPEKPTIFFIQTFIEKPADFCCITSALTYGRENMVTYVAEKEGF
jgi:hypothetical protein